MNSFILCAIQIFAGNGIAYGEPATLIFFILSVLVEIGLLLILQRQPMNRKSLYFEVKFLVLFISSNTFVSFSRLHSFLLHQFSVFSLIFIWFWNYNRQLGFDSLFGCSLVSERRRFFDFSRRIFHLGFAIYGGYGLRNSSQRSINASKRNHSTSQTSLISS